MSITNPVIVSKIKEKTLSDEIMMNFIQEIISHENENAQYSNKYKKLIDKAVEDKGKHNAI